MIPRLNLNQPDIVALTGLMLRNPGCNSFFIYGQIIQTICSLEPNVFILSSATIIVRTQHLKMSILAGSERFWRGFYPNPWKGMSFKNVQNKLKKNVAGALKRRFRFQQ